MLSVFPDPKHPEDEMKSNFQHQKEALTTDQKFRVDDEHIHEEDKRHLKESEEEPNLIPTKGEKTKAEPSED
jgi:hypothetical protein